MKKFSTLLIGLLVAFFVIGVIFVSISAERVREKVYLYVVMPLSGDQSIGGINVEGGVKTALDKYEDKLPYEVEVVSRNDLVDGATSMEIAKEIKQRLDNGDKVIGIIGGYNSGPLLYEDGKTTIEYYGDIGIPFIGITTTNPEVTNKGLNNIFRVCANDVSQGKFLAQTLKDFGFKKVVVLHTYDEIYAEGLVKEVKTVKNNYVTIPYPASTFDFTKATFPNETKDIIQQVKESITPDTGILLVGDFPDAEILVPQLREAGIDNKLVGSDALYLDVVASAVRQYKDIYVSAVSFSPQTCGEEYINDFQRVSGFRPDTDSTLGYSATTILMETILATDSYSGQTTIEYMHSNSFNTCIGELEYNENGDLKKQVINLYEIVSGEFISYGR